MKATTLALLLTAAPAYADSITVTTTTTIEQEPSLQPPSLTQPQAAAPPHTTPNMRVTVAAGPALGFDTKDDCGQGECVGLHVQAGGVIAPRLLLLASIELMDPPDLKDRHHVATVSVQHWATSRLWFELGVGVGTKRTWHYPQPPTMDLSGVAPAGTSAVGVEIFKREGYSFGVQARFASTIDVHHTSFGQLMAGFSWY